jgi:hypothetical protein
MDAKQLHILQHTISADQFGRRTYDRNHFVTSEGTDDYPHCMALVQAGLMTRRAGSELSGGGDIFYATREGIAAVFMHSPAPPKLTRSQQRYEAFLNADCGLKFGEWLRMKGAA